MSWAWTKTLANFDLPGFRAVELAILDFWLESLKEDQRAAFLLWKSSINYIQRVEGGKEIDFYVLENGKPTRPKACEILGFPTDGIALRLVVAQKIRTGIF